MARSPETMHRVRTPEMQKFFETVVGHREVKHPEEKVYYKKLGGKTYRLVPIPSNKSL